MRSTAAADVPVPAADDDDNTDLSVGVGVGVGGASVREVVAVAEGKEGAVRELVPPINPTKAPGPREADPHPAAAATGAARGGLGIAEDKKRAGAGTRAGAALPPRSDDAAAPASEALVLRVVTLSLLALPTTPPVDLIGAALAPLTPVSACDCGATASLMLRDSRVSVVGACELSPRAAGAPTRLDSDDTPVPPPPLRCRELRMRITCCRCVSICGEGTPMGAVRRSWQNWTHRIASTGETP